MDPEQQQDEVPENGQGQTNGHPAWQEILEVIPDEFHGLITPKLQAWDQGVQQKLQDVRSQYDPYKPLVDNSVPVEQIEQALYLATMLERSPAEIIEKAIEHYNLEQFRPQAVSQNEDNDDDYGDDDEDDVTSMDLDDLKKNPAFKEFFDKQAEIEEWYRQQQEANQRTEAEQYMENYLNELHEKHGDFDDMVVTALLANGFDGDEAVQQFQNSVNQAAQALAQNQAPAQQVPVVMGGSGTTGSGLPQENVNMGAMKSGDINDIVVQFLQNSQSQG